MGDEKLMTGRWVQVGPLEIKSLIIQVGQEEVASADENGVITYAEGYNPEKVMAVIAQCGVHLLKGLNKEQEVGCIYGLALVLTEDNSAIITAARSADKEPEPRRGYEPRSEMGGGGSQRMPTVPGGYYGVD